MGQMTDEEQEMYLVDFEQKYMNRIFRETEADRDRRENPSSHRHDGSFNDAEEEVRRFALLFRLRADLMVA